MIRIDWSILKSQLNILDWNGRYGGSWLWSRSGSLTFELPLTATRLSTWPRWSRDYFKMAQFITRIRFNILTILLRAPHEHLSGARLFWFIIPASFLHLRLTYWCPMTCWLLHSDVISYYLMPSGILYQGRLNAWAQWALARGPNKHKGPTNIDEDYWCFTATFVYMVGWIGRATSEGNEAKSGMKQFFSDMHTPRFEHGW